jgi:prepilin-type N-terminal cleavage/methylation domain-containing protein
MIKINKKGFTLIELLVVVAIIGLLSSIVLSSVNSARKKARDARTLQDLKQITLALNMARDASPTGAWPGISNWQCLKASGTCWKGGYSGNATIANALAPYMPEIPKTQASNSSIFSYDSYLYLPYWVGAGGSSPPGAYIIYALEGGAFPSKCNGYYAGLLDTGYWYCYSWIGN